MELLRFGVTTTVFVDATDAGEAALIIERRVVIRGVFSVPGFRELAVEVTGRRGLAPVVPGDGSGRHS